jgi:hypothetical protein
MRQLAQVRDELVPWLDAQRRTTDLLELVDLAEEAEDADVMEEAERDAA